VADPAAASCSADPLTARADVGRELAGAKFFWHAGAVYDATGRCVADEIPLDDARSQAGPDQLVEGEPEPVRLGRLAALAWSETKNPMTTTIPAQEEPR